MNGGEEGLLGDVREDEDLKRGPLQATEAYLIRLLEDAKLN